MKKQNEKELSQNKLNNYKEHKSPFLNYSPYFSFQNIEKENFNRKSESEQSIKKDVSPTIEINNSFSNPQTPEIPNNNNDESFNTQKSDRGNDENIFDKNNFIFSFNGDAQNKIKVLQPNNTENILSTKSNTNTIHIKNSKNFLQINNIVSSCELGCDVNPKELSLIIKNSEYQPKRFSGLKISLKNSRTTALVYLNGKISILGAKTEEDSKKAAKIFAKMIKNSGYTDVKFTNFKIENIASSCDIGFKLSLSELGKEFKKNHYDFRYEPGKFPALRYYMNEPKLTFLFYSSGKIVIVGAKKREDIIIGYNKIFPFIVQKGKVDE